MCKKPDARLVGKRKEHEKEINEETQVTVPHLRSIHRKIKKTIFPAKR